MKLGFICMESRGGMFHYFLALSEIVLSMGYQIYAIVLSDEESEERLKKNESKNLKIDIIHVKEKFSLLNKVVPKSVDKKVKAKIYSSNIKSWIILWDSYFLTSVLEDNSFTSALIVHDVFPHRAKGIRKFAVRLLHRRSLKKRTFSKALITSSFFQYKLLKKEYPYKRVFYLPLLSSVTKEMIEGQEKIPELSKISDYFLFFGRIETYKGVDILIKSFKEYSGDRNLVIAGKGNLSSSLKGVKMGENIIIINRFIKESEIKDLFERAYCIIFPYIEATQVGPISLAYYYNKPVIISAIPPLMEKFDFNAPTGILVSANNVESLNYALELMDMKEIHSTLKNNCKSAYSKYYNLGEVKSILSAIMEVLKE